MSFTVHSAWQFTTARLLAYFLFSWNSKICLLLSGFSCAHKSAFNTSVWKYDMVLLVAK